MKTSTNVCVLENMNREDETNDCEISQDITKIQKKSCKFVFLESEFIVHRNGSIKRKMKSGKWKEIKNNVNHNRGYNVIMINKKQFTRSQIIAHVFMDYDMLDKDNNKKKMIINKDKNKLNCCVSNLMITSKNHYLL